MRQSAVGWPRRDGAPAKTMIGLRVDNDLLDALDEWIAGQQDPLTRQDAIKRILAAEVGAEA